MTWDALEKAGSGLLRRLDMDADLVVLSACQTGTGTPVGGDELLGLGRVLVAAGARAAIVTLWPVDDACTAVLMARFHAARARGLPSAEALQQTQQWMRGLTMPDLRGALDRLMIESGDQADQSAAVVDVPRLVATAPPSARRAPRPPSKGPNCTSCSVYARALTIAFALARTVLKVWKHPLGREVVPEVYTMRKPSSGDESGPASSSSVGHQAIQSSRIGHVQLRGGTSDVNRPQVRGFGAELAGARHRRCAVLELIN